MNDDFFIFCLEGVPDTDLQLITPTIKSLEQLAYNQGMVSIYKSCDTLEGLEESLSTLLYDDHHFQSYKIIYLVMKGEENSICLNQYYYSLTELAEIFEGKLKGKIIHFANQKVLDLTDEESQYFLDITGALAISGYGKASNAMSSFNLDTVFFGLTEELDNVVEIVEELHQKQYALCKMLDFRLYY